jgi:hypothetical protein
VPNEMHNQGRATGQPTPGRPSSSNLPKLVAILVVISTTALCFRALFRPEAGSLSSEPVQTGGVPAEPSAQANPDSEASATTDRRSVASEDSPRGSALTGTSSDDRAETAYLTGVVVDAVGRPIHDARVTAISVVEGICPASQYQEWSLQDLDPSEGLRGRSDANGEFALFGATPGVQYAMFADLQGEDVWWIDECATPIAQLVAPHNDMRLGLPYGIVNVAIGLPADLAALMREGSVLDIRLRIRRGADDERVVSIRDSTRIAVEFGAPVEITAEGIGLRERTLGDIAVTELVGSVDVTLELESTGLAHRLEVIVVDDEGAPIPDTWVYGVSAFDPPRFDTLRTSGCSARDDGVFVFEFLEAREHAIVAVPDSDTGLAPAGSYVSLPPSAVRELHLTLGPGEFVEVRIPTKGREIHALSINCPDQDFDIGQLVEWVEAGHGSWERVRTLLPGRTYRSTFRLPLGRAQLRYTEDGVERVEDLEVKRGQRSRLDLSTVR